MAGSRGSPDGALLLACGDATATIAPGDGGRLGQLEVGSRRYLRDRVDGPDAALSWGSYPLIPWSNRIEGGRFEFEGTAWQLDDVWRDGTAIHGLACTVPWRVIDAGTSSAHLGLDIETAPWTLRCEQTFDLRADALAQEVAVVNEGAAAVPVGLGIHPWFVAGPVTVPADLRWPTDDRCLPTGPPRPVAGPDDLRRPVVPPSIDHCYTGLTGHSACVGDLELSWTGPVAHVVVFTGVDGWTCLEPVTNANDGFNLLARGQPGSGVVVLDPGARVAVGYRFRWPADGDVAAGCQAPT